MPLYEYACRQCGRQFEDLVSVNAPSPPCPGCASTEVQRLLSAVSVGRSQAGAAAEAPSACGSCGDPRGPGACARN